MLLIGLIGLAAVWAAVLAIVLGLCLSAARGDRVLPQREQRARIGSRRFARLIVG